MKQQGCKDIQILFTKHKQGSKTTYSCTGFSLIMLILFRCFVGFLVWLVLIGVTLACIGGTIYLW
jgi:hypothetical protein